MRAMGYPDHAPWLRRWRAEAHAGPRGLAETPGGVACSQAPLAMVRPDPCLPASSVRCKWCKGAVSRIARCRDIGATEDAASCHVTARRPGSLSGQALEPDATSHDVAPPGQARLRQSEQRQSSAPYHGPVRVLLVTLYWPPAGGGGVQRPLKFATHLPGLGIETHVLAPDD